MKRGNGGQRRGAVGITAPPWRQAEVAIVEDLEARATASEQLRRSEARLAEAERIAHMGSWDWDLTTGRVEWSDELYRILGLQPGEIESSYDAWMRRVHPDDLAEQLRRGEAVPRGTEPFVSQFRVLRADGQVRHVLARGQVIADEAGAPVRVVGACLDVTEQRQAEQALRDSEEQYRQLFDHHPLPMWVADRKTLRYLAVNEAAIKQYGYNREQFLAMTVADIRPEEDMPVLLRDIRSGRFDRPATRVWRHRRRDGSLILVEVTLLPLRLGRRPAWLLLANDITARRRAEEVLGLSRNIVQAQEAERRRVARDLHDGVNQLLSAARFRLQGLEQAGNGLPAAEAAEAASARGLLDQAIQEIRRISHNLRPAVLDDLGLQAAVRSHCEEFSQRTGTRVDVRFQRLPRRLPAEVELTLYRIVQESLNNVEKHATAGRVWVELAREGHGMRLLVRDDGRGFAARRSREAKHFGLVNMRERAAFLGGALAIASSPGGGTEIAVSIPATERPRGASR